MQPFTFTIIALFVTVKEIFDIRVPIHPNKSVVSYKPFILTRLVSVTSKEIFGISLHLN